MAETFTVTMSNEFADRSGDNVITIDWTSHATDGTCDGDICSTFAAAQAWNKPKPTMIQGYIRCIETIPGEEGDKSTNCPTDDYDIVLKDPYAYDLTGGNLADRDEATAERIIPSSPIPVHSEITLGISGAGNSKQGRIIIFVSPHP